jgi:small subunit ribosomal protein S6
MFAIRGSLVDSEQKEVYDKIIKTFKKHGGDVSYEESWGLMNIAYKIKHEAQAYYHVVHFSVDQKELTELERKLELNNDVVRYLTTKLEGEEEIFTKKMYEEGMDKNAQDRLDRKRAALPKTRATTTAQLEEDMKKIKKGGDKKPAVKAETTDKKIQDIIEKDLSL